MVVGVVLGTVGHKEDDVLGAATEAVVPVTVRSERAASEADVPERRA